PVGPASNTCVLGLRPPHADAVADPPPGRARRPSRVSSGGISTPAAPPTYPPVASRFHGGGEQFSWRRRYLLSR
uniref:Uncharacterized protein n=1 Tax=Triticum urartu TaxID=4572 RepID=A0A8R7US27_TRIUA